MKKAGCYGDGQSLSRNQTDFSVGFSLIVKFEPSSLKFWLSNWIKAMLRFKVNYERKNKSPQKAFAAEMRFTRFYHKPVFILLS
jgi:hypothetical protein